MTMVFYYAKTVQTKYGNRYEVMQVDHCNDGKETCIRICHSLPDAKALVLRLRLGLPVDTFPQRPPSLPQRMLNWMWRRFG